MKWFFLIFFVLISNWRKAKSQLFFTLMGITIACSLWASVDAINNQTTRAQEEALVLYTSASKPIIVKKNSSMIDEATYVELRLSGWKVSPVIKKKFSNTDIEIIGLDFLSRHKELLSNQGIEIDFNHFSKLTFGKPIFFASQETKEKIQKLGLSIKIIPNELIPPGKALGDISSAQQLLNLNKNFSYLVLTDSMPREKTKLPSNNLIMIDDTSAKEFQSISDSFNFNLRAFGFLSFCVGMFIVYTSVKMAFSQRIDCIKSLKLIGINNSKLGACLIVELLILAIIAGSLGTLIGLLFARNLLPGVNKTLGTLYASPTIETLKFSPDWFLLSISIAIIGTLVASLFSLSDLAKISPLDTGKIAKKKEPTVTINTFAVPLILASVSLYFFAATSNNLILSFITLAIVIITGCTLLPYFLILISTFLQKFGSEESPLYNWIIKDTNKYAKLIFTGYLAFFMALSINIGVHGMVMSFKTTFIQWLEKRIFADIYIQITDEKNLVAVKTIVKKYDAESYPIIYGEGRMKNEPLEIYGFKPAEIYEKNWPMSERNKYSWRDINEESSVFVNEQFSHEKKLGIGDRFQFQANEKQFIKKISGVYPDFGNSRNQIMMSMNTFSSIFPEKTPTTLAIKIDESLFSPFMRALLESDNINYGTIINEKKVKQVSLEIFDNTFKISFQLALVTLIVAGFTLYTNLVTVKKLRMKDILPLNAIGIPMLTLLKLDFMKNISLTFVVSIFSIFMGIIISLILSDLINPNAFGWEFPLTLFPTYWLQIISFALLISLMTSFLSLRFDFFNRKNGV